MIFYGSSVSVSCGYRYCEAPKGSGRVESVAVIIIIVIISFFISLIPPFIVVFIRRGAHTKKINIFHYLFGAVAAAKGINFLIYPWNIFAPI